MKRQLTHAIDYVVSLNLMAESSNTFAFMVFSSEMDRIAQNAYIAILYINTCLILAGQVDLGQLQADVCTAIQALGFTHLLLRLYMPRFLISTVWRWRRVEFRFVWMQKMYLFNNTN